MGVVCGVGCGVCDWVFMSLVGGEGECSEATHTTHPTNPHTHEALWAYEAFDVYGGGEVAGLSGEGVLEVEFFGE